MHSPKHSPNSPDAQHSTSALHEPDRRLHARYTVHVQIEILREDSEIPLRCETTDLSRGGCYIRLVGALPVGIRLHATLWLDGYPLVIRGLIVTRHPEFGNGIMFVDFEGQGEALLTRYLDGIAK
ncbi:MAG: PilZ domain-containing protein [Terriglobales bacterium]|jgi:PilZ domain-containing protein